MLFLLGDRRVRQRDLGERLAVTEIAERVRGRTGELLERMNASAGLPVPAAQDMARDLLGEAAGYRRA
ncbi:hypothetical protein [Nonomuraea sp. NPDC050310]|uniref:hypothetical protein n=1 Tax=Nonomuraea sp. NPDC050310 TaxID=3154935 RepID=UPI0033F4E205